jgi:hypothetical protein
MRLEACRIIGLPKITDPRRDLAIVETAEARIIEQPNKE